MKNHRPLSSHCTECAQSRYSLCTASGPRDKEEPWRPQLQIAHYRSQQKPEMRLELSASKKFVLRELELKKSSWGIPGERTGQTEEMPSVHCSCACGPCPNSGSQMWKQVDQASTFPECSFCCNRWEMRVIFWWLRGHLIHEKSDCFSEPWDLQ